MVKRAVFVGRFQPFHLGHLIVSRDILEEVDELIVVIGSAQYSHTIENPFTSGERMTMIREALREAKVSVERYWIVPVPDVHRHMMWVAGVVGYTPKFGVVYGNEPLTRRLFMEAGFNVKSIPFHKRDMYSSTEIRERMLTGRNWQSLVPRSVAAFVDEIDGVQRLKDLKKTDKVSVASKQ
jgi:nicotinamide-nucleotide adenylyltransferase